ncbi:probable ATP-dependent RNA helicase DDX20 [Osmerus eperlanus]|uniref:probable ATP-dependent RNA helicase DDX20 n=1 Tax=Osmerus eperlanus TaxID=29151 RepID=UPI002E0DAF8B
MATSIAKSAHDIETRTRTGDVLLLEGIDFNSLLLSPLVLDGLAGAGFQRPSPIQLKAIPLGRCGLDLIVQAKSGTGKTCVFSTIALDSLVLENSTIQVLVLAPTREIAVQIHGVVMAIGSAMEGLECHVFIGGRPVGHDKIHLKKCHIAVGSPGRIKQLIELGLLSTSSIRLFVLDEADKLLEEGSFQDQINWIFSSLPVNKQMLALSATYPESLAQHLARYMREPVFVRLNPTDPGLLGLKQYYQQVRSHVLPHRVFEEKVLLLLDLFSKVPFNQALVFSNLHSRAQNLADILSAKGLPAVCISGGLTQDQRLEAMSKLKQYQCRVLISTDLTSRGIDAEKVNLVINLDVPQDWETYMHRVGRAGRFGTQGLAVTYCCYGEEENKLMAIAQKCCLNLCPLPDPIEPGLMPESCDWDVTVVSSASQEVHSQLFPKTLKRRQAKAKAPAPESFRDQNHSLAMGHLPTGAKDDGSPRKVLPVLDALLPAPVSSAALGPSLDLGRKEQQEALPKIPPISAFKSQGSESLTFLEAELDFQSFINEGLGRSVEIIRQFRGQGEGNGFSDQHGHEDSHTLHDTDDGECDRPLTHAHTVLSRKNSVLHTTMQRPDWNRASPSRSASDSSGSDMEDKSQADEILQSLADQTLGVKHGWLDKAKPACSGTKSNPPPLPHNIHQRRPRLEGRVLGTKERDIEPITGKDASKQPWENAPVQTGGGDMEIYFKGETVERVKEANTGKVPKNRRKKETTRRDGHDGLVDGDIEGYWGAHYRAWERYYASMSPTQQQSRPGYQYTTMAQSWLAAYRMNSVYMEELLKH